MSGLRPPGSSQRPSWCQPDRCETLLEITQVEESALADRKRRCRTGALVGGRAGAEFVDPAGEDGQFQRAVVEILWWSAHAAGDQPGVDQLLPDLPEDDPDAALPQTVTAFPVEAIQRPAQDLCEWWASLAGQADAVDFDARRLVVGNLERGMRRPGQAHVGRRVEALAQLPLALDLAERLVGGIVRLRGCRRDTSDDQRQGSPCQTPDETTVTAAR